MADKGTGSTGSTPRTEREAASDLMEVPGLLDGVDDEEEQDGQNADPEEGQADEDQQNDPDGLFDVEEEQEGDGEENADADSDEDADEEEDTASREPTITIEEDGKKVVLTAKEVRESRLRHADYTRKTMAVAEERKAANAEKEQAAREKAAYGKLVTEYRTHLDTILKAEPDWEKLKAEDPQNYLLVREQWRDAQAERDAAKAEEKRLADERQGEEAKAFAKRLDDEAAKLLEALPAWKKDQKVAQREGAAIRNFLRRRSLTDEEIASVLSDHRSVLIVRDAALFEQSQRRSKTKIRPAPKGKKTLRPGSPTTAGRNDRAGTRAARTRLAETGHVRDAASLLERIPGMV